MVTLFPHTVTSKCDLGVDWISSGLKLNQEDGGKFASGLEQYLVILLDELFVHNKREAQTVSPPPCFHCKASQSTVAAKPLPNLPSSREQASTHDYRNGSACSSTGWMAALPE